MYRVSIMPRTTAATKSKTTQETLSAPVIEQVVTPSTEKVEKTVKKAKAAATEKTATPTASTATVTASTTKTATPEVVAATPENEVVVDESAQFSAQVASYISTLAQLTSIVSSLKSEFRTLEKKYAKDLKVAQKAGSKRKRKTGNRAPSGFVKPTRISDTLAVFLSKPLGTEMARTEVTSEINKYVKANKLYAADNGRKIVPDDALKSLLQLEPEAELTYFNLQRFMSRHFLKRAKDGVPVEQTEAFTASAMA